MGSLQSLIVDFLTSSHSLKPVFARSIRAPTWPHALRHGDLHALPGMLFGIFSELFTKPIPHQAPPDQREGLETLSLVYMESILV